MSHHASSAKPEIAFRPMTEADIPFGMHLKAQAGWNQTEADWRRLLALAPAGCFLAEADGQPAATAAALAFGPVAWVSMVLVDSAQRGRGVGTAVMRHVLEHLDAQPGIASIRLDATDLGEPIYRKLGFAAQFPLIRLHRANLEAGPERAKRASFPVSPAARADLDALCALDHAVTRTERGPLLARLLNEQPRSAWLVRRARRDGGAVGYLLARPGENAVQLGPGVARDREAAVALIGQAIDQIGHEPAFIDVPAANVETLASLADLGFTEQRRFTRMTRGTLVHEHVPHLLASSGPEKG